MRLAIMAIMTGFLLGAAPLASAETCTTTISGKTITGDLVVPAGMSCEIESTTVNGSVRVEKGAMFFASFSTSGSVIIFGNLTAVQCGFVILGPTGSVSVNGSVQVEGCSGPSASSITATISGNAECISNPGSCKVVGSTVGGNLQFNANAGFGSAVSDNFVGGNLQCVGNGVGLVVSGNKVADKEQGQCASSTSSP
jgi:hypothetical protein